LADARHLFSERRRGSQSNSKHAERLAGRVAGYEANITRSTPCFSTVHQGRFKRKPRTSISPPIPDISLRRIARRPNRLTRDEARRLAAQAAGAAASVAADKRRRVIRLRSACRPHDAEEAKRPQISGVYHWAGAARLHRDCVFGPASKLAPATLSAKAKARATSCSRSKRPAAPA
jgi:hypothetical protein